MSHKLIPTFATCKDFRTASIAACILARMLPYACCWTRRNRESPQKSENLNVRLRFLANDVFEPSDNDSGLEGFCIEDFGWCQVSILECSRLA